MILGNDRDRTAKGALMDHVMVIEEKSSEQLLVVMKKENTLYY